MPTHSQGRQPLQGLAGQTRRQDSPETRAARSRSAQARWDRQGRLRDPRYQMALLDTPAREAMHHVAAQLGISYSEVVRRALVEMRERMDGPNPGKGA